MSSIFTLPVASSANSLESFIQAANRYPILTQEEETRFARQYRNDADLNAARQLVLSHLRLVIAIARGYLGYGLPHGDLIQEGNVGLMKAVKRFDPERGVRLVSFAIHWIKAEIHEYILRNWRIVRMATTKAQRKLFFNLRSLKQGLDWFTNDEVKSVARQLGVKPEEVVEMEARFAGQEISLEPGSEDDDDRIAPINYLSDTSGDPSKVFEALDTERVQGESLELALSSLDARSRRIIEARWLREKDTATLHDLAAEFGVSAERIRQIEQKAMQKMRALLSETA